MIIRRNKKPQIAQKSIRHINYYILELIIICISAPILYIKTKITTKETKKLSGLRMFTTMKTVKKLLEQDRKSEQVKMVFNSILICPPTEKCILFQRKEWNNNNLFMQLNIEAFFERTERKLSAKAFQYIS
jgi:hypothetical protein